VVGADAEPPFDPALLREVDLKRWQRARQVEDGKAPATINRAIAALRGFGAWLAAERIVTESPMGELKDLPLDPPSPRSIPVEAIDALLRAVRAEADERLRLRDEAILALLAYAGLRVQEACDVQLRDLDLAGSTVTVRSGKGGRPRRVPLHTDALRLLKRYLTAVRCPEGMPAIGSDAEREPLLAGFDPSVPGRPMQPGINQRLAQRVIKQRAVEAAGGRVRRPAAAPLPSLLLVRRVGRQQGPAHPGGGCDCRRGTGGRPIHLVR
jgi:integrase